MDPLGFDAYVRMAASHAATTADQEDVASGDGETDIEPASTANTRAVIAVSVAYAAKRNGPAFHVNVCAAETSSVHPELSPFAVADTLNGVSAANRYASEYEAGVNPSRMMSLDFDTELEAETQMVSPATTLHGRKPLFSMRVCLHASSEKSM